MVYGFIHYGAATRQIKKIIKKNIELIITEVKSNQKSAVFLRGLSVTCESPSQGSISVFSWLLGLNAVSLFLLH